MGASCALFAEMALTMNRDDCRFPHVLPDGSGPGMHARVGPRPRPHSFGNGLNGIEERMGAMQLREVSGIRTRPIISS